MSLALDLANSRTRFLVDDVEEEWLNGDDFDFVHMRNMVPILKSPVNLLKQIYEYVGIRVPHI